MIGSLPSGSTRLDPRVADRLMALEVEGLCGAGHGERAPERLVQRNGYGDLVWDTRAGTIELNIPKLRKG